MLYGIEDQQRIDLRQSRQIGITAAQSVTLRKARPVTLSTVHTAQTTTLTAVKRFGKTNTIASAETVTLARTFVAASFHTVFTATGGSNSAGWASFNLRNVLSAFGSGGSKFRLTLFASTAASCTIDGLHAGHGAGGNSLNYDGTQVAVTVGGTQSFTIPSNSSVVTDQITYTVDGSKQFIVACHFTAAASAVIGYSGGATAGFKSAADESGTTTVSGYSTGVGNPWLVKIVEVL